MMINNFGGSARARPRINLGGKKKELTKDELLRKAAQERQLREQTRRRENAARTIQRQWATCRARREVLDVWRSVFDVRYRELRNRSVQAPFLKDEYNYLLSCYFFFFHPRKDLYRTLLILSDIVEATASSTSTDLLHQVDRKLDLRSSLAATYQRNKLTSDQYHTFFSAVRLFALSYSSLFDNSLYHTLSLALASKLHQEHVNIVLECILTPLRVRCPSTGYWCFARHILTLDLELFAPQLLIACRNINVATLSDAIFDYMVKHVFVLGLPYLKNALLLKNFISITVPQIASLGASAKSKWMTCTAHLIESLHDNLVNVSETEQNTMDIDGEHASQSYHNSSTSFELQKVGALIGPQMDVLTGSLIRSLLEPTFSRAFPTYAVVMLQCWPVCRDELLMNLSLYASSPEALYNLLETAYNAWQFKAQVQLETMKLELVFYVELLSRVLLTMTDNEFFDSARNPLSLAIIESTASRLKTWIFSLYMKYSDTELNIDSIFPITVGHCQEIISKCLQQIHVRDTRRNFLPKGFWLYTEKFDMRSFVQQAAMEAFIRSEETDSSDDDQDDDDTHRTLRKQGSKYDKFVSPRIKILSNCPFMLPFDTRVEVLRALVGMDTNEDDPFSRSRGHQVTVRREHEFVDGFEALWRVGAGIKDHISVDYRDVHGIQEAGIDGGGLTKEFLTSLCQQAFHPDFGLFVETPERMLFPNPSVLARSPSQLQRFEFLGRVIAKCIYQGILIDVTFAPFFLLNWVGKLSYLDDLQSMDKDLYNGLIQLKNYTGDVENDLALDFTLNEEDGERQRTIKLLPDGQDVPVTSSNRLKYIHLVCNYKLNTRLAKQSQAFVRGLTEVLDPRWLSMFNQNEMQALIGGAPVAIDISDLRKHTAYGGYEDTDTTVRIFWDVLSEFTDAERRSLIKFVTSTPRPPLLGFKELRPSFCLRNAGSDMERLPTASTCVNLLKLPAYTSHEVMRRKLRLSITSEAGFDLS